MYGVPQKKFSLFWEHVTFHNLCLLQGIYVKCMFYYSRASNTADTVFQSLDLDFKRLYIFRGGGPRGARGARAPLRIGDVRTKIFEN